MDYYNHPTILFNDWCWLVNGVQPINLYLLTFQKQNRLPRSIFG